MQNPRLLIALVDSLYQQKEINRETYEKVLKQIMERTERNKRTVGVQYDTITGIGGLGDDRNGNA